MQSSFLMAGAVAGLVIMQPVLAQQPPQVAVPQANGRTFRIDSTQVQALGQLLLNGTEVRLNNFTPNRQGDRGWHRPNDSRIRLSPLFGGSEFRFNLPETRIGLPTGQARYYVNQLNSSKLSLALEGKALKISMEFANRGRELEGRGFLNPPSFNLRNSRLDVFLTPTRDSAGRLTYSTVRVSFNSDISPTDTWSSIVAGIGNLVGMQYRSQIKSAIENEVRSYLQDPSTRAIVTERLQERLDLLGIRNLTDVRVEGNAVVLEQ
jgi:hypothetical protein